jgi:L-gulono-1,4-lactone dehydrogenase
LDLKEHQEKVESIPEKINIGTTDNLSFSVRKTWKNCIGNQEVSPLRYYKPATLAELIKIIKTAEQEKRKVRAVGSGHSFSEIVQTTDFLIDCHGLNNLIDLDKSILKSDEELKQNGYDPALLVHAENGITIKDLNKLLDERNLALINMGGYDAQTIAGVISTATHGTGIGLGPISSQAVSLVLVGEGGTIYRIEPANGITDPQKYKAKYPNNKLIQSDDWYNAVTVSMGCTGVFYSVILRVMPSYYLKEERLSEIHETSWEDVKKLLSDKKVISENRHFEVWINPYKIKGTHRCLITRRNIFSSKYSKLPIGTRTRHWFLELIIPYIEFFIRMSFRYLYKLSPVFIDTSMKQVIDYDGYIDKSFHVLNLGNANFVKGFSGEYAISLKDDLFIKAADKILELAEKNKNEGNVYHSAPISLRFVKQSDAFLAMMQGEDKCMIEVPVLVGTPGGFQILQRIEDEFVKLGIRSHWGQYNQLNGEIIQKLYPQFEKWKSIYNELNKNGTFDNYFTDKCGFRFFPKTEI